MRLRGVSPSAECSHHVFQAFAPSFPFTSSKKFKIDGPVVLSNPFVSKTRLKSHSFNKVSRSQTIRRFCSSNLDDIYGDEPPFHVRGLAKRSSDGHEEEGQRKNSKLHCAVSKNSSSPFIGGADQDSFLNTRFDFLEPMMLGNRPEFLDWPDQETAMWAAIEQKAKSLDIPLSLRMIKKKLQWEEGSADSKEPLPHCSVKAAFSSMVFIIVELQSCALQMREALCDEDLESISVKVQKDMHSSFVWLFQQVFSRTPALMLHVMLLLADFGVYSIGETSLSRASIEERQMQQYPQIHSSLVTGNGGEGVIDENTRLPSERGSMYQNDQLESVVEIDLWKSMVDDATEMREGSDEEEVLDHDAMVCFVSPVSVEIEPDGYEDFLRTDLLYQMNLSMEPNNPLILCNYAQYLYAVARDYDRAEECFKRAVQVLPPDAESLAQYGNFLWAIRKDYLGAEESFLHALAIEPKNAYYASRYASFLWGTGGEETCFPLNNSHNPNL